MFSGNKLESSGERLVKLDKLAKILRREMAANPMKAGVLGVLLLGGMYFWGPLAWKWLTKKGIPAAPSTVGGSIATTEHASGTPTSEQAAADRIDLTEITIAWQEIQRQREADPLARSADYRPQWDQTFQVTAVIPATERNDDAESKKQENRGPQELGLVLQGVFIGSHSKKAVISGKVYREGDLIAASQRSDTTSDNDRQSEVDFQLVHVFRKMVEVKRAGKTWQLKLATTETVKANTAAALAEEPLDEKAVSPQK